MNIFLGKKSSEALLVAILTVGGVSGCVEEGELNNNSVEYIPEERPLGIIAGADGEFAPETEVVLLGRLVGTVTNQTVKWAQTSGTPLNISDWTSPSLSFTAPVVDGIEEFTFSISALDPNGDVVNDQNGNPLIDEAKVTVYDLSKVVTYEVEDTSVATLSGAISIATAGSDSYVSGHSGSGHSTDMSPGDAITFNIDMTAETAGYYSLYLGYLIPSDYGGKVGTVTTNGVTSEVSLSATSNWEELRVGIVSLTEGSNTIEVCCGWNYYRADYIKLIPAAKPAKPLTVSPSPVNANASQEVVDLLTFLSENYGTSTLSGQTEFPAKDGSAFPLTEYNKIVEATADDAPAIVAFDYMNYSASYSGSDATGLTESIISEHNTKNIVVSALFHWRAPSGNASSNGSFYTSDTSFNLAAALANKNSTEYAELLADIDIVSMELKKLADAGVPVLWRPLHEAEGGWFWWGAQGSDALKELWLLMYDRMTNTHGLNNLIWVFTHTSTLSNDWYPGDMYVDIVGYDGYATPKNDQTVTFNSQFSTLRDRHNGKKMVALTETGTIPSVETMHKQNAWWSFFITWNSETWDSSSLIGPDGALPADIDANYAFDGVLNLDDVPGGREKVEAGVYDSFEADTLGWQAQLNWSPTDGLHISTDWASSARSSLSVTKDLSASDSVENVVLQVYPEGGINVSGAKAINISVQTIDAGTNVNAHIFFKSDVGESWPASTVIDATGTMLTIDLTDLVDSEGNAIVVETVSGLGVRFQGMDATQTHAQFFIDQIELVAGDDSISSLYDFEPVTGWESQVGWAGTTGITLSNEWSNTGASSLAFYKNLAVHGSASDVVLQTYPEGGIDVSGKTMVKAIVSSVGAGTVVDAHIFFKSSVGESWPAAVVISETGTEISVDLTSLTDSDGNAVVVDKLDGLGIRFNGSDSTAIDAKYYVDSIITVAADDSESVIYDFEGTGSYEFQVNWGGTNGIQLAQDWSVEGMSSLLGVSQLVDGDDNVILQVYPDGGILLGDVTTLKVTAYVKDAGENVQVQLLAKDKDFNWRDGGAIDMVDGGVELTLDISDVSELSGFGVRFMSPNNSTTPAKFYIDNVVFE